MLAGEVIVAEAGGAGEGRVGHAGVVVEDGAEVEEGLGVRGSLGFCPDVVNCEDDDRLVGGN